MLLPALCAAYLLGALPTGVLMGKIKGVDVRKQGSGNVGATNIYRLAGKGAKGGSR
jgi:glycerol-3-phosphate acyltransferase PlsY